MQQPSTTDPRVQLTRDIPELALRKGDIGFARTVWNAPVPVYEVEFKLDDARGPTRSLLLFSNQVELMALS